MRAGGHLWWLYHFEPWLPGYDGSRRGVGLRFATDSKHQTLNTRCGPLPTRHAMFSSCIPTSCREGSFEGCLPRSARCGGATCIHYQVLYMVYLLPHDRRPSLYDFRARMGRRVESRVARAAWLRPTEPRRPLPPLSRILSSPAILSGVRFTPELSVLTGGIPK